MAASPATIEQLARDTVRITDPDVALRALGALRQELEQVEPQLVKRALETGASWSQIARALGISKQAAHRKHRHLTDLLPRADGGHKILVTSEARRSVLHARQEAARLGQPSVGTEHILLGILRCERSHAVQALQALGVTHQAAEECLRATLPGVSIEAANGQVGESPPAVSPPARRILEGSLREAVNRGDGYIGVEHLLLALLTDSRNGGVQTLEALRVTPKQVRRQLEQEWDAISQTQVTETGPATTAEEDAGVPGADASTAEEDAGVPGADASTAEEDAGVPGADASTAEEDAGVPGADASTAEGWLLR